MATHDVSTHSFIGENKRESSVLESNVRASQALAEMLRTTLGPKGLDKMLVSPEGEIVVTNDGASILNRIDITHPVANLVVEVAQQQDTKVGDGTTSAVILASELVNQAGKLLEHGVHPTKLIEGYHIASTHISERLSELARPIDTTDKEQLQHVAHTSITGKWDDQASAFLAERAVDAVRAIEHNGCVDFERITRKTFPGGSFYDSTVVDGLVIDMQESSTDVVSPSEEFPRQFTDATIALVDRQMTVDKPTGVGAVDLESHDDYEALLAYETNVYNEYVERLSAVESDVLFCQQAIDDPLRYMLARNGILAVERTRRDELEKLARATGAHPVQQIDDLTVAEVGRGVDVERRTLNETKVTIVSGFEEFDQVSLIARGGTAHVAEETKRVLDDCFYVLKLAIEDGVVLPGGGATEAELARELRSLATEYDGREQLAISAFADALEIIPKTLAETAGMNPIDALIELRTHHHEGDSTAGLDLESGTVVDMFEQSVLEPVYVKQRSISGATEAANLIVRIDDRLSVTGSEEEHDHEHSHDHSHRPNGLVESTEGYPWSLGH